MNIQRRKFMVNLTLFNFKNKNYLAKKLELKSDIIQTTQVINTIEPTL